MIYHKKGRPTQFANIDALGILQTSFKILLLFLHFFLIHLKSLGGDQNKHVLSDDREHEKTELAMLAKHVLSPKNHKVIEKQTFAVNEGHRTTN